MSKTDLKPTAPCAASDLDFVSHNNRVISIKTGKTNRHQFRKHLELCAACTSREACLEMAIQYDERFGIWGGKFPYERRDMMRRRNIDTGKWSL